RSCQIVEVVSEEVRVCGLRGAVHDFPETQENSSEFLLLRRSDDDRTFRLSDRETTLGKDAGDAGVGVLEVRTSIAVEGHELVPIELVVTGAILPQIRVLYCTDANRSGNGGDVVFLDPDLTL